METEHNAETAAPHEDELNYGDEFVLHLENGNTIRTDSYADHPDGSSYVRVCGPDGAEIAYWSYTEWAEDPQLVMGAFLGSAGSAPDVNVEEVQHNDGDEA